LAINTENEKNPSFFICLFFSISLCLTQGQYGNIRGRVLDEQGNSIPGVSVILESEYFGSRSAISSEGGIFRFLNVSAGLWHIRCEIPGFRAYILENIDIRVGLNVDLKIELEPAALDEEITIVAEYPIVDTKRTGTVVNFTQQMLQELPSARDPWAIMQQAPGILMSVENVGGSESGYQFFFRAKGSMGWDNTWGMDGIPITNMASYSSPMFYDFGTFEEIQIVTGGNDCSQQTGGVSINMITRRGSNRFQVVSRAFFTNKNFQGDNRTQELEDLNYVGDQINQIMDYGFQLGGPIKKDKLWFWVGYGVQDVRRISITGYPDETKLDGFNSKLNFQLLPNNRMELFFLYNIKLWNGLGTGATRPPETTLNQDWSTYFMKLQDEHIFSDNFMLALKLSYLGGPYEHIPLGGEDVQTGFDIATCTYSDSFASYRSKYPSYVAKLEGNYFLEKALGGDHEFRFGLEYRLTTAREESRWAGDIIRYYIYGIPYAAEVTRQGIWDYGGNRYSFYINDLFTRGRLMFNLGLRLDKERSWNNDASVEASKSAPDLLPAMTYPGSHSGPTNFTISPRIGLTYDLTGNGKTILRGNLARYGNQMGILGATVTSASSDAYAIYFWDDFNRDNQVSTNELLGYPAGGILEFGGFDPWNPGNLESTQFYDKDIKAELTDEFICGIETALFKDFSFSANFILRRYHRLIMDAYYDKKTQTKIMQGDYIGPISGSLEVDGEIYNYEYWTLSEYRPSYLLWENRPDYYENYTGFEIYAKKRFSKKWLMNASFTYQIHTVHYGNNGGDYYDPTNVKMLEGSRSQWLGANWIFKVNFLYQLPWKINFSCFANARQGYVRPQLIRVETLERARVGLGVTTDLHVEPPGNTRLPTFYNFDVSLSKNIRLSKYGTISFIIDAFNVFNFNHPLSRNNFVSSPRYNEIQIILNPRVIRFGIRYRY
jgi:hypothetical protein